MKQTHTVVQGTPEWAAHRAKFLNASDAAAAAGLSKYKTRSELLREKATGLAPEHDSATLARFAKGHEYEATARPWAEEIIGTELYPVVMTNEIDGLPLSASFDGIDMLEEVTFEHKTGNASLLASLETGAIPDEYKPQLEQGLLISGAARCLFMASSGDKTAMRFAWYESDSTVRKNLLASWKQFAIDLANYVPEEVAPAPVAVAAIDALPALTVELVGSVTSSNLTSWQTAVTERIQAINTDLKTDEDFAVAEKTVKFLGDGEKKLEMVKSQALAQTASIDELFRTIDELSAEMKAKRLNLDKLVKARKESIRMEIMQDHQARLAEHVKALNERIGWHDGCPIISPASADFASAIRGKKTVASLREACGIELMNAKLETSELADRIEANKKTMGEHAHLFPDFGRVCVKAQDDFRNLVAMRVTQHKEAEAKREEETRQRIRIEEERKANAESREAAMPKVLETIDHGNGVKTIVVEGTATSKTDSDDPALWRSTKQSIDVMLDSLTLAELETVGNYIGNKQWRKAA